MSTTSIERTQQTWNPVSGCTRASLGCDHCYAVTMTHRLAGMGQAEKYGGLTVLNGKGDRHFNGVVRTHDDALTIPLKRRKPTTWFVNSMSDLFHRDVPFAFIDKVFAVMALCPQHTFQVLTKRPERMAEYLLGHATRHKWGVAAREFVDKPNMIPHGGDVGCNPDVCNAAYPLPNVWLGTSVEDQQRADERIPHLLRCPAAVRFLSMEPLLGAVDLRLYLPPMGGPGWMSPHRPFNYGGESLIHLAIIGGESGPHARPMHPDWARSLRDQCADAGVPFFFKQWGEWAPADPHLAGVSDSDRWKAWVEDRWREGVRLESDTHVLRVGKKAAGRMFDGQTHDGMPTIAEATK